MVRVRRAVRQAAVLLGMAAVGRSCGPSFPVAVFVRGVAPAVPYGRYAAGDLGVVQPTYPVRTLAVAYAQLSGRGLSQAEQAQATALQEGTAGRSDGSDGVGAGETAWIRARLAAGLPGGFDPVDPASKEGPTIGVERQVPGQEYETFTNCLDDAFRTAAATLAARQREHGAGSAEVLEWVRGQDAVFSNCAGPQPVYAWSKPRPPVAASEAPDRTPRAVEAGAPVWLQKDRAYQVAAAAFYRTDYDEAMAGFRAIAADGASPWAKTARYVVARAMLRRATVGQRKDVPAAKPGGATYDEQQARQTALESKLPERFREARAVLVGIEAEAAMAAWHDAARELIDLIDARLDPATQAGVLADRLTAPAKTADRDFQQNLVDLTFTVHHAEHAAAKVQERFRSGNDMVAWMEAMRSFPQDAEDAEPGGYKRTPEAAATALAGWRRTGSLPWLVAAMSFAEPSGPGAAELAAAAAKVPEDSPGWLTVTYQRLRLEGAGAKRAEVEAVLARVRGAQPADRSAINLIEALLSKSSPTMEAFLEAGARVPATTATDGVEDSPTEAAAKTEQVCGPKLSDAERALFAHDTATVLNQRMPVRRLVEAALSSALPPNLTFQVAQSAWTRAVLLDKPELAKRVAPMLIGCHDSWRPVLDAYAAAATADARHVAGLRALMRFASTEPTVRDGEPRPEGFATYSQFRDNWWCGNAAYEGLDEAAAADPKLRDRLFAVPLVPETEVADPSFLTAADRAEARVEVAALQKVPGAPDYFAREALAWYRAHPGDTVNVELLGEAERAMRNGCRSNASKELNHQLFVVVQGKFPGSVWAKKYPTWE